MSLKVAGYAGLTLALPYVLFQLLAFVLPGLTVRERRLIAPAVAGSAVLFLAGVAFAWWALVPAALRFLVSYGADVVEPLWSIERYLDFVLLLMLATGRPSSCRCCSCCSACLGWCAGGPCSGPGVGWCWVLPSAGAVLTPSTDPITMLLLAGAITALFWSEWGSWRSPKASDQKLPEQALGCRSFSLKLQAQGLAKARFIPGCGDPSAHFSRQTKTIHNIQHFRDVRPIRDFIHRERLLLQIGPHHLQEQTLAANHQLKVKVAASAGVSSQSAPRH